MIGRIKGLLIEKQVPTLLIDVGGIGYEIHASMNTISKLPDINQEVIIHTHLIVREDAHILYGFYDKEERSLFCTLIKVNGVGPKLALTILSSIDPTSFVQCVQDQDAARLVRLPGVGKKTAERLIIEMRDRLADWHFDISFAHPRDGELKGLSANNDRQQQAIHALITLGYKPQDASRMISKVDDGELSVQELIRLALKGVMA